MDRGPSRAAYNASGWSVAPQGKLKRKCRKCGALAYSPCVRVRTLKVTGQDLTLPDPTYTVRLKNPHRER